MSLKDFTLKLAETVRRVDDVKVTLNRELLVGTDFVHSLIRGKITELGKETRGCAEPRKERTNLTDAALLLAIKD